MLNTDVKKQSNRRWRLSAGFGPRLSIVDFIVSVVSSWSSLGEQLVGSRSNK